jgi:hypothetical protein
LQPSLQQRLPSINSALQHQSLSSHKILHHPPRIPELQTSLPPPRHVLPQRMDSTSSTNSSTQESVQLTTQPFPPPSTERPLDELTAHEDLSASPPHVNQQRHRGKQTKAACIPCRKRKSKVPSLLPVIFSFPSRAMLHLFYPPTTVSSDG